MEIFFYCWTPACSCLLQALLIPNGLSCPSLVTALASSICKFRSIKAASLTRHPPPK
jgi:hypothetical protein